jgi:hypothetical protein
LFLRDIWVSSSTYLDVAEFEVSTCLRPEVIHGISLKGDNAFTFLAGG